MTDSDSINPFAAPKKLAIRSESTINAEPKIDVPIQYEATPTIDDLKSALQPNSAIIFACILLSLPLLVFPAVLLRMLLMGLEGAEIMMLIAVSLCSFLAARNLRSKLNAVNAHLRLNPDATAPLTGELTNQGLKLRSVNRLFWQPHDGLVFCHTRNNQLSLCHDPRGQVAKILPTRGFQNPTLAIQFLKFQANKISKPLNMTEPLIGPSMVGDQSTDAIAFEGILKGRDLKKSPLEKLRRQRFKQSATVLMLVNVILLTFMLFGPNWNATILIGVIIFVYDLWALTNILRSFLAFRNPEVSLIAIQGWLNEREIALLHNIGQSLLGWKDFKSVGVNDTCIWLEPYGGRNRFVLLPRHFFDSDSSWQTAAAIAVKYSTK